MENSIENNPLFVKYLEMTRDHIPGMVGDMSGNGWQIIEYALQEGFTIREGISHVITDKGRQFIEISKGRMFSY